MSYHESFPYYRDRTAEHDMPECASCGKPFLPTAADEDGVCPDCWFSSWEAWWDSYIANFTARSERAE